MLRIKTYKLLASFLAFLSIAVLPNVALADVQGQLQNGVDAAAGGAPSCTISESGGGTHAGSASAKNTIIYALVGILVVAFAQVIVHFVLAQVT
jgi:hypothetical protein